MIRLLWKTYVSDVDESISQCLPAGSGIRVGINDDPDNGCVGDRFQRCRSDKWTRLCFFAGSQTARSWR
jgi:hypothetical protein